MYNILPLNITPRSVSCRFTSDPNGVMVASDVAARGLDIPQVEHVIHYQTPKNSEVTTRR